VLCVWWYLIGCLAVLLHPLLAAATTVEGCLAAAVILFHTNSIKARSFLFVADIVASSAVHTHAVPAVLCQATPALALSAMLLCMRHM
jgi:hypothetical protein